MKQIVTSAILICAAGCGQRGDPRLSGTFVSDKAATLAYLEATGEYEAERLQKLGALLGKLEITYHGRTATTVLDGKTKTEEFKIMDSGPNHVTIETQFGSEELLGKIMMVTNRIEFTHDGYWVTSTMMEPSFKEKFVKRRNPTKASTARNQLALCAG